MGYKESKYKAYYDMIKPNTAYTNKFIQPITEGFYGGVQDDYLKKFNQQLASSATSEAKATMDDAKQMADVIGAKNKGVSEQYQRDLSDIKKSIDDRKKRIEEERVSAKENVKEQEQTVGLESQIQANKAASSGKLSDKQQAKVSRDITNSFANSMLQAKQNLNTFEQGLNDKLFEIGITEVDKRNMYTSLQKVLDDEAINPLLNAIAVNATNRKSYGDMFNAFYSDLLKGATADYTGKAMEEDKIVKQTERWNAMSEDQKRNELTTELGKIVSLPDDKLQSVIDAALKSNDPAAIYAYIRKYESLDDERKAAFQSAAAQGLLPDVYPKLSPIVNEPTLRSTGVNKTADTTQKTSTNQNVNTTQVTQPGTDVTNKTINDVNKDFVNTFNSKYIIDPSKTTVVNKLLSDLDAKLTAAGKSLTDNNYYALKAKLYKALIDKNYITKK